MSGLTCAWIGSELWESSALTRLTTRARRRSPHVCSRIESSHSRSGLTRLRVARAACAPAVAASLRIRPMEAVTDVYTIPQEHLDFCAMIGQIAREKIAPRSAEIDERAEYPWDARKLLAEQDILGLPFGVEHGGTGTGTLMLNMSVEEIAKVDASCALILMVQELGTLPIQLFGTDELKERL